MQKRLNKQQQQQFIVTTGVDPKLDDNLRQYHTFHPGDAKKIRVRLQRQKQQQQLRQDDESDDSFTDSEDIPSRFRVVRQTANFLNGSTPIKTANMFGILDRSLHDDPTPIKERSLKYQEEKKAAMSDMINGNGILADSEDGGTNTEASETSSSCLANSKGRADNNNEHHHPTARQKLKFHHRSKSSSPKRVGENARLKNRIEKLVPQTADWRPSAQTQQQ